MDGTMGQNIRGGQQWNLCTKKMGERGEIGTANSFYNFTTIKEATIPQLQLSLALAPCHKIRVGSVPGILITKSKYKLLSKRIVRIVSSRANMCLYLSPPTFEMFFNPGGHVLISLPPWLTLSSSVSARGARVTEILHRTMG